MKMRTLMLMPAAFMLLLAFPSLQAQANSIQLQLPPPPQQEEVTIFEIETPFGYEFVVSSAPGTPDIIAFGVRNDLMFGSPWVNQGQNPGWAGGVVLTPFEWDTGTLNNQPWAFQGANGERLTTNGLGTFRDLFGQPSDGEEILSAQVAFYFDDEENNEDPPKNPITGGSTRGGFNFSAEGPASPFAAVTQNVGGPVRVIQGDARAVPVPAAAWMGLGMISLLGAVRRLRRRRSA